MRILSGTRAQFGGLLVLPRQAGSLDLEIGLKDATWTLSILHSKTGEERSIIDYLLSHVTPPSLIYRYSDFVPPSKFGIVDSDLTARLTTEITPYLFLLARFRQHSSILRISALSNVTKNAHD